MASIFLGLNRGVVDEGPDNITEGASTGSTDVELRIDTGKGLTRLEVCVIVWRLYLALLDGRSVYFTL